MTMDKIKVASKTLFEYISNEGKNMWRLEKCTQNNQKHILTCKLCETSHNVLNIMDSYPNEENKSEEPINCTRPMKNIQFWKGIPIDSADIHSTIEFQKRWKCMRQHTKQNSIHVAAHKILTKELD
eukprot:183122_1